MIQRINLIPEELRAKKPFSKLPVKYIVVVIIGLLYIVPTHLIVTSKVEKASAKVIELEKKKLELVTNNMRFAELQRETEKMINELKTVRRISGALKKVIKRRIFWSDILKEVSYMVPEKLWLTSLASHDNVTKRKKGEGDGEDEDEEWIEKSTKSVTIKGSSYNNSVIKKFIAQLENSYFLESVKLKYVKKRVIKDIFTVYDFEVASTLKENDSSSEQ